ncbi:MAG: LuxR C-terminal-related transcriptional regulator [bacterium]|nr:LuxR C-terminal-related transcriptional regulator [bacterium]MDI1338027.1 LuxR C-terminal-related transcriptional regulator [Lacunisphaera sp.]
MASVESKLRDLLELAQTVLDDLPIGLLVVSAHGTPLWFNREAEIVCAVWNRSPLRRDALPLKRADFAVPPVLWRECQALLEADGPQGGSAEPRIFSETERGLHAVIRLQKRPGRTGPPACFLQLDYRRPRGDRDRPLTPGALSLMSRLTFREREVALRIRDGLTTEEISRELRRSRLTIKTQLAGIFRKLGVANRSRVTAMLNR